MSETIFSPEVEAQRAHYERLTETLISVLNERPDTRGIVQQYCVSCLQLLDWGNPRILRKFFVEMNLEDAQFWVDWNKKKASSGESGE